MSLIPTYVIALHTRTSPISVFIDRRTYATITYSTRMHTIRFVRWRRRAGRPPKYRYVFSNHWQTERNYLCAVPTSLGEWPTTLGSGDNHIQHWSAGSTGCCEKSIIRPSVPTQSCARPALPSRVETTGHKTVRNTTPRHPTRDTVWHDTEWQGTAWRGTARNRSGPHGAGRHAAGPDRTARRGTTQNRIRPHGAGRHGTGPDRMARHSKARQRAAPHTSKPKSHV